MSELFDILISASFWACAERLKSTPMSASVAESDLGAPVFLAPNFGLHLPARPLCLRKLFKPVAKFLLSLHPHPACAVGNILDIALRYLNS